MVRSFRGAKPQAVLTTGIDFGKVAGIPTGGLAMSQITQSLGIDKLPRDQRIALVQEIWDTVAAEPHPPLLTEAQRQELERRVADDNANPDDVVPWEQVKAQALSRMQP
jgi:putative addiction module component (TIGR02574 family)